MIRSMTAFASGERVTQWGTLGCELRSVNHRFLEIGVRLHDDLRALEPVLRERIAARIQRGKLDLTLRLRSPEGEGGLQVNPARLRELSDLAIDLTARFPGLHTDFTQLLQFPGVMQAPATDAAALQAEAMALLDAVLDEFIASREREGGKLATVIGERVDGIAFIAADVRTLMPAIRLGQRAKLEARLADLAQPADPGRLEQERSHRDAGQDAEHDGDVQQVLQGPDFQGLCDIVAIHRPPPVTTRGPSCWRFTLGRPQPSSNVAFFSHATECPIMPACWNSVQPVKAFR